MTEDLFTTTVRRALGADFLSARLSSQVALCDVGADAIRPLLDWRQLGEILTTRPLQPPRLRLHSNGAPVPVERYTDPADSSGSATRLVRPEGLYRELREGASMVLDAIDRLHPPIREATDDLMRLVRERAQANLYVIWGRSQGFDTHWDDHDTFIVQLSGSKSWRVHGQGSRPHPMKVDTDHTHSPPDTVVWEGVLRPGHVLHVPRGWWHTVTGTGEASMHLTFGFTPPTGIDWAQSLIDRLRESEFARRDLPRFASPERRRAHHHELVRLLCDIAEREDIDAFLAERDARFPRRQSFCLPWAVADTTPDPAAVVEFVPILTPSMVVEESAQTGRRVLAVTVAGRRYRLPEVARPVLATLAERRSLSLERLTEATGLPSETVTGVVGALVRHHLALLHPSGG